jgi:hypothetical protein
VGSVDPKYGIRSGHRFGPWAIAYVKHRYWGLPWWSSGIVVLSPGWFEQGEDYFVDGNRGWSKFLPLVYIGPCNRTGPLRDAVLDMRILNAAHWHGVRVINRTLRRNGLGFEIAPDLPIEIIGPSGSRFVTSDAEMLTLYTMLIQQYRRKRYVLRRWNLCGIDTLKFGPHLRASIVSNRFRWKYLRPTYRHA